MKKLIIILLLFAPALVGSASIFINSFNSGQLGPDMKYRYDLEKTAMGSEELENILIRPQGMAYKRPGTEYIDTQRVEILGDYPTLRTTTAQADPGLTHDIAISSFSDLKTYFQDNHIREIQSITEATPEGHPGWITLTLKSALPPEIEAFLGLAIDNSENYTGAYTNPATLDVIDSTHVCVGFNIYVEDELDTSILVWNPAETGNYFYLTADIDASETANADYLNGYGWYPSYTMTGYAFNDSTLDGNGYTISGLYQSPNRTFSIAPYWSGRVVGGFLYDTTGTDRVAVANLTLADVNMSMEVGGAMLCNAHEGTQYINCHVSGNITIVGDAAQYVGGFVGWSFASGNNRETKYYDCSSSITIDGIGDHTTIAPTAIGGFVGSTGNENEFHNCSATGNVNVNGYGGTGATYTGGFIGRGLSGTGVYFNDCHATGNVEGDKYVGGFSGGLLGYYYRDYATGNVTANDVDNGYAGGFIGNTTNSSALWIQDCYAWGNVTGGSNSYAGGFAGDGARDIKSYSIGTVTGGAGKIGGFSGYFNQGTYCYWDTETSGLEIDGGYAEGKTTTEMKQKPTYVDWDFDTIWYMDYTGLSDSTIRLIPFEYSVNDAYVLEMGHTYIGFLRTTQ